MKYDFKEISEKQKTLDSYILKKLDKKIHENSYWSFRIIALFVEINELINEIKFFKFWKKNKNIDQKKVKEEFVDCLHFLFSLGNTIGFNNWIFITDDIKKPLEIIYFDFNKNLIKLNEEKNKENIKKIFNNLMDLAFNLNLSNEEIHEIYNYKNKINFDRQDSNY